MRCYLHLLEELVQKCQSAIRKLKETIIKETKNMQMELQMLTWERGIKCTRIHASIVWRITKDISVERLSLKI